jgi:hypothetical protein
MQYGLTWVHLAAFELINTVQSVAASSVQSSYEVSIVTLASAFVIKTVHHILFITMTVPVRMVCRLAAFTILDVMQPMAATSIQPTQEEPLRTVAPSVVTTNTGIVVCKCIVGYEKACILILISVLYIVNLHVDLRYPLT